MRVANTSSETASPYPFHHTGTTQRDPRRGDGSKTSPARSTPGSTRATTAWAAARVATGTRTSLCELTTDSSTRTQPRRLHSSGSTIRMLCTRPGGTVSWARSSSPWSRRSPSGDSATVQSYSVRNRPPLTDQTAPRTGSSAAAAAQGLELNHHTTTGTASPATTAAEAERVSSIDTARSRGVTRSSSRSGASPRTTASAGVKPAARASSSARSRGVVLAEEGQLVLGVGADDVEAELGHPGHAGQQRAGDVDRLDPVEADVRGPAEEEPAADAQFGVGDGVVREPPAEEPVQAEDEDQRDQGDGPQEEGEGGDPLGDVLALLDGDAQDRGDRHPGAAQRREEVQPPLDGRRPLSSGLRDLGGLRGHRPADLASPSSVSRSRSRSASSGASPGIFASVAAAAVCSWREASLKRRSSGPEVTSTSCIRP